MHACIRDVEPSMYCETCKQQKHGPHSALAILSYLAGEHHRLKLKYGNKRFRKAMRAASFCAEAQNPSRSQSELFDACAVVVWDANAWIDSTGYSF